MARHRMLQSIFDHTADEQLAHCCNSSR